MVVRLEDGFMSVKKKKKAELSVQDFARLRTIFDKKKWPIEDGFESKVFENFCGLLAGLKAHQRELMFTLTERFLWVRELDYVRCFSRTFDLFVSSFPFNSCTNIVICPLLPEEDFGKSKSSIMLLYFIKANIVSLRMKYPRYSINFCDSPALFNCAQSQAATVLCLVDDFIGSGDTAVKTVDYFLRQYYPLSQIAVLSLVAMEKGLARLQEKEYHTYTSIVETTGITGRGRDESVEIKTMEEIETAIRVSSKYRFGYAHSQALVKMIRTPNNTFPIYWRTNGNVNVYAPFPR